MSVKFFMTLVVAIIASTACNFSPSKQQSAILESECERVASFGQASLCLPSIVGMTECYRDPLVKDICDAGNYGKNTFLGCYLRQEDFNDLQQNGYAELNPFIRIYAMTDLENVSMKASDLAQFIEVMKSNYLRENWSRLEAEAERNFKDWDFDRPVLLEDYPLDDSAHTFVLLARFNNGIGSEPTVQLQFMNTAIMNERLIWFTYHQNFEGIESINVARPQNDFFALRFLESNQ